MNNPHDSVVEKVAAIFAELTAERAESLTGNKARNEIKSVIASALCGPDSRDDEIHRKNEIAFHLTDWNSDAAFLVALHLFPERFTPEEIEAAVCSFMWHVPNHIVAAAKLGGYLIDDTLFDNAQ